VGRRRTDEHLKGYCLLQEAFNDEAPSGDLDIEAEVWDEERVRNGEERARVQGRRQSVTAALAPDGSMVALTEMMTTEEIPERASQGGTLVIPGHRGHRLGPATKVQNLSPDFPLCTTPSTSENVGWRR